jgi:hypothetical protein
VDLTPDTIYSELEVTAHLLASGFEALLAEVQSLSHRERCLKDRLDFAYDEVCGPFDFSHCGLF